MPFVKCKCPICKKDTKAKYNQGIQRGEILFFMEYNCECGFSGEIDYPTTPEKFRNEIINESGLWELKCYDRLTCLKFLRKKLLYSMEQIKELKEKEIITFQGTEIEMKGLGKKMKDEGMKVIIEHFK